MGKWALRFTTALIFGLLSTSLHAGVFKDSKIGYSVWVPDSWQQIPFSAVAEMKQRVSGGRTTNFSYADAFEPSSNARHFMYPYALVQTTMYPGNRSISSVSEKELQKMVAEVTGMSPSDVKKVAPDGASSFIENIGKIQAHYFTSPPGFKMDMSMSVVGVGKVHGRSVGFFGKDSLLMLNIYAPENQWQKYSADFDKMLDAFQIDAAQKISFGEDSEMNGPPASRVIGRIVGFVVFAVLFAVFISWKFRKTA